MNDTFYELLVKKNKPDSSAIIMSAINIIAIVCMLVLTLYTQFAMILVIALGFVFYYLVYPKLSVEYEYSLLNADLTVDAVYNKTKKKKYPHYGYQDLRGRFSHLIS